MILKSHAAHAARCDAHRSADVQEAERLVVEQAWRCGVVEAVLRADPDIGERAARRVWSDAWFVRVAIGHLDAPPRPGHSVAAMRSATELRKLDLAPLRAAISAQTALMREVAGERKRLHMTEDPEIERNAAALVDGMPPRALERSAVRWPDGAARPLFHATASEFEAFKPLSHFGPAVCVSHHVQKRWLLGAYGDPLRVVACWVDIRNPCRVEDLGTMNSFWLAEAARRAGILGAADLFALTRGSSSHPEWWKRHRNECGFDYAGFERDLAALMAAKGCDGLVYANAVEGGGDSWVALDASQVSIAAEWRYEPRLHGDPGYEPSPMHGGPGMSP